MIDYIKIFTISLIILTGCISSEDRDNSSLKKAIRDIDGEPVIPRVANKIHIYLFRNFTKIPSLSEKVALKLKEQINMDGRLAVVPENINADLKIEGIVVDYQLQPIKFGELGEPIRKRVRIIASFRLIDLIKKKEIFFERSIQAFDEFSDKIPPITTEINARNKVVDILAKRIALKTINGWYTKLMTPVEKGKK